MTDPLDTPHTLSADAKPQRGIQSLDSTGELLAALVAAARPLSLRDLAAAAGMVAVVFVLLEWARVARAGRISRESPG